MFLQYQLGVNRHKSGIQLYHLFRKLLLVPFGAESFHSVFCSLLFIVILIKEKSSFNHRNEQLKQLHAEQDFCVHKSTLTYYSIP
ncbi:hypothetical protein CS542_01210 [Pedobacter sp. IW39]|nr:hypothetical protein CS542_01210 [Pedobacter sp. IW39]